MGRLRGIGRTSGGRLRPAVRTRLVRARVLGEPGHGGTSESGWPDIRVIDCASVVASETWMMLTDPAMLWRCYTV
jgi:hypothetical protein